jgi:hypothetical protein
MIDDTTQWLHHPDLGELPAQTLIDCVFVLAPNGRILHFHLEETDVEIRDGEQHYNLNGTAPLPERARCQVIPPFVTTFSNRS